MPAPSPEAIALGERYRIGLVYRPRRGRVGERLAGGTGSSLEFQDRRNYAPGDDIRHLDWRAFARTDALLVRQYREEILPRVELLLDASASMAVDPSKASLTIDLVGVLASAARGEGFEVSVLTLGDAPARLDAGRFLEHGIELTGRAGLADVVRRALGLVRVGSLRILVSDFLSPHSADALVRGLARDAGGLALVQVLSRADVEPPVDVAQRLTDSETGEELDLVIDSSVRARYLARLRRLIDALASECRRNAAEHVELVSDTPLDELCRERLAQAGVLTPA